MTIIVAKNETFAVPLTSFGPAANGDSQSTPHKQAESNATIPTERSISAQSNTNVRPVATIARTAPCFKINESAPKLRKSLATTENTMTSVAKLIRGAKSAS